MSTADIIIALIILVIIVYFYAAAYAKKNDSDVKAFAEKQPDEPLVIWFHKKSCPWCVKMKKDFAKFKKSVGASTKVIAVEMDELKSNFDQKVHDFYMALFDQGPKTVPYVLAVYRGILVPYDGDRSAADLTKWAVGIPNLPVKVTAAKA